MCLCQWFGEFWNPTCQLWSKNEKIHISKEKNETGQHQSRDLLSSWSGLTLGFSLATTLTASAVFSALPSSAGLLLEHLSQYQTKKEPKQTRLRQKFGRKCKQCEFREMLLTPWKGLFPQSTTRRIIGCSRDCSKRQGLQNKGRAYMSVI